MAASKVQSITGQRPCTVPMTIDPTQSFLAYGDRALPKLNRELLGGDTLLLERSLMNICALLHDPEKVSEVIETGIINSVTQLLTCHIDYVREKCTEALHIVSAHNVGRKALIQHGSLTGLSQLLNDSVLPVRVNANTALERESTIPEGAQAIIDNGMIPLLVKNLSVENEEIQQVILDTLYKCTRVDPYPALKENAMTVFTTLLDSQNAFIRTKACSDIMALSFCFEGKEEACKCKAIPKLIHLMNDNNCAVRAEAAGALMSITIGKRGKIEAVEQGAIIPIVSLLYDKQHIVRLNATKVIVNLAEYPPGRKMLKSSVDRLNTLEQEAVEEIESRSARIAKQIILWEP
eukprot:Nk52_evm67s554 gene=Nk52_evmTU67s554